MSARQRKREWRSVGKRKADRMVWLIALAATLVVIGLTLVAGHLRSKEMPSSTLGDPVASSGASGDDQ